MGESAPGVTVLVLGRADVTPKIPVFPVVSVVKGFDPFHQRSFRVERPTSTSIIVMIQKRTTTWFSFHPFNS